MSTAMMVGNLAADAEVKEIETSNGKRKVAEATIYCRYQTDTDSSFQVQLSIWEGSIGWGILDYLKQGSLIAAYGAIEPSPYMSKKYDEPRAGLQIGSVDRLELISVKDNSSDSEES
jgi:single-stranded DNA-binding protein